MKKQTVADKILEGLKQAELGKKGFGKDHLDAVNLANAAPAMFVVLKKIQEAIADSCAGHSRPVTDYRYLVFDALAKATGTPTIEEKKLDEMLETYFVSCGIAYFKGGGA